MMVARLLLSCLTLCAVASTPSRVHAERPSIARIDLLTAALDSCLEHSRGRWFGDTAGAYNPVSSWVEFSSAETRDTLDCADLANVWQCSKTGMFVGETIAGYSGDWVSYVGSYYRPDGSLAKLVSRHNTFYGNVTIDETRYFDRAGVILRSRKTYRDLRSGKLLSKMQRSRRDISARELAPYPTADSTTDIPYHVQFSTWEFSSLLKHPFRALH